MRQHCVLTASVGHCLGVWEWTGLHGLQGRRPWVAVERRQGPVDPVARQVTASANRQQRGVGSVVGITHALVSMKHNMRKLYRSKRYEESGSVATWRTAPQMTSRGRGRSAYTARNTYRVSRRRNCQIAVSRRPRIPWEGSELDTQLPHGRMV
jgi:hypothetical protein